MYLTVCRTVGALEECITNSMWKYKCIWEDVTPCFKLVGYWWQLWLKLTDWNVLALQINLTSIGDSTWLFSMWLHEIQFRTFCILLIFITQSGARLHFNSMPLLLRLWWLPKLLWQPYELHIGDNQSSSMHSLQTRPVKYQVLSSSHEAHCRK